MSLVGLTYRYGIYLWHVRAVVDDRLVVRRWWRSKQRWEWSVVDADTILSAYSLRPDAMAPALLAWARGQEG